MPDLIFFRKLDILVCLSASSCAEVGTCARTATQSTLTARRPRNARGTAYWKLGRLTTLDIHLMPVSTYHISPIRSSFHNSQTGQMSCQPHYLHCVLTLAPV